MKRGLGTSFAAVAGLSRLYAAAEAIETVSLIFKLASIDSGPTPEQKAALQAADDRRKAAIALEDAQRQEAAAEEDRRRAFFSTPAPAY